MNRYARKKEPYVPKLEKIELSQKNIKLRWVAAIAFFAVGAASLAYSLTSYLTPDTGWEQIEINGSYGETCADELLLMYDLGSGEASATAEKKAVSAIYTETCESAYRLFHCDTEFDGLGNLASVNANPNREVTVEPALYDALALLEEKGIRSHYLGPVYESYQGIFGCTQDFQTADYDPYQNESLRDYFARGAGFASDPEAVQLELLGEGRVRLAVSADYLAFARENATQRFLDLNWMKNAFAADYLAEKLTEKGYTHGVITSHDGFTRSLAGVEDGFYCQLYDREPLTRMEYRGDTSLVELRGYPVKAADQGRYYTLESGEVRVPYLDTADGLPKAATGSLVAYSQQAGCGELLCSVLPAYVGDSLDTALLAALAKEGTYAVYPQSGVLCHTDAAVILTQTVETKHVK